MSNYEVATLKEYGYRDYHVLKKILKVLNIIVVFAIIAILYLSVILIALQSFNSSADTSLFEGFSFKWYGDILNHQMMISAIRETFIVSIAATLISTVAGLFIAVGIFYLSKKKRQWMLMLNNIPLLNADIVTGICLMILFSLFLPIFPYFFGEATLILAHVFFTLPYVVLSVLPKLGEIDPNLMDASLDLGVKPLKSIVKVIVPSVKAGIFAGMLLAFTVSFDDFVVSYFTQGNGVSNLSIWIYSGIGRKELTPAVYAFNTLITFGVLFILVLIYFLGGRKNAKKN